MSAERLLLVDDEDNLRSMLTAALRHSGFDVAPAATGREALDRVAASPPDLWQNDFGGDGGVVETYIGYLRKKLDSTETKLIHTIRGVGYTLRET